MEMNLRKYKHFISDIILNIIAAGSTAMILQFVVYPLLNKGSSPEIFGEMLVMMSVVNIVAILLGNSLNNIRLIYEKEYKDNNISGDFPLLLLFSGIANVLITSIIIFLFWSKDSIVGNILLIIISVLTMLRAYLIVDYRLKLNFKKILQHSLIYSLALILGSLILVVTDIWQLVFLVGETASFVFLVVTTELLKEPLKFSSRFKNTFKKFFLLSISSSIGNILNYVDRIIIFPFLGAHQVAVFFSATVIGKMASFIVSPISGVVLSYISKKKEKMSLKVFGLINVSILAFSFIASILTFIISKYALSFLYPNLYFEASDILLLSNFAVILFASCSLSQTIVLRYSATYLQIVIQVAYGLIYIIGGVIMIHESGLKGFCIAALLAAIFKFFLIFVVGTITLKSKKENTEM
jgi:O-antigen/teichoic acid export membrane protein